MAEYVGKSDKQQGWTRIGLDAIGKARRDDNEAGHQSYECVQDDYISGLTGDRIVLVQIASKDFHGAHADAERKECVSHGIKDHRADPASADGIEVGNQIEADALSGVGKQQGVEGKYDNQYDQQAHHDFGDSLDSILKSQCTYAKGDHHSKQHENCHAGRRSKHRVKGILDHLFRCSGVAGRKGSGGRQVYVVQHPSADHGIKHHQQIVAHDGKPFEQMPLGTRLFQQIVCPCRAPVASAADTEFTDQDRHPKNNQKYQIYKDKQCPSIFSAYIRKFPDISQTYGTSCGYQDKP